MTDVDEAAGPLDVAALDVLGERARGHPLVATTALRPDAVSPRRLEVRLDADQYPRPVERARLDVRWFEGGDYSFHYLESREDADWQCRWDRHPNPDGTRTHFHPPPDASAEIESTAIEETHHLGVLFAVLDWIESRVRTLHDA